MFLAINESSCFIILVACHICQGINYALIALLIATTGLTSAS